MLNAEKTKPLWAMSLVSLSALRDLLEILSVVLPFGALVLLEALLDPAGFARWRKWRPGLETWASGKALLGRRCGRQQGSDGLEPALEPAC